jgi:hypothetical protein
VIANLSCLASFSVRRPAGVENRASARNRDAFTSRHPQEATKQSGAVKGLPRHRGINGWAPGARLRATGGTVYAAKGRWKPLDGDVLCGIRACVKWRNWRGKSGGPPFRVAETGGPKWRAAISGGANWRRKVAGKVAAPFRALAAGGRSGGRAIQVAGEGEFSIRRISSSISGVARLSRRRSRKQFCAPALDGGPSRAPCRRQGLAPSGATLKGFAKNSFLAPREGRRSSALIGGSDAAQQKGDLPMRLRVGWRKVGEEWHLLAGNQSVVRLVPDRLGNTPLRWE